MRHGDGWNSIVTRRENVWIAATMHQIESPARLDAQLRESQRQLRIARRSGSGEVNRLSGEVWLLERAHINRRRARFGLEPLP